MATSSPCSARTDVHEIDFMDVGFLQSQITSSWSEWGTERLITRSDIDAFGTLTDNHQWIHENDARCKTESLYGEVIAHGLFILTLLPSLLPPESFTLTSYTHRIVRGGEWRFPAPVFVDDIVHARSRLLTVRLTQRGVVLMREIEVWSVNGLKPAVTCSLQLQYF